MRNPLTSLTYKRLSAIALAVGMPFGLSIPAQLMFLIGCLAEAPSVRDLPAHMLKGVRKLADQARRPSLISLFNLLALWMVFTSFFAVDIGTSLPSALMGILIAWLCLAVIVPYILGDQKMHTPLASIFAASASIGSIVSTIQAQSSKRLTRADLGAFGCNAFGNVTAMSLLVSVLLLTRVKPRWRPVLVVGMLAQLTALVLTGSRGAWVALAAAICVLVINTRSKAIIVLTVAAVLVFCVVASQYPHFVNRLQSIVSLESNMDRVEHFEIGFRMIQAKPLTGFGIGNISRVANDYREQPKATAMAFLHNVFVEFGATTGIPGLVILIALIGGLVYVGVKCTVLAKAPLELCVVFSMIVAQLAHLQFDMILSGAAAMPLGFIPIGILLRYCSTNKQTPHLDSVRSVS